MIETVIAKHEIVRQLCDHQWLYLFRLDVQKVEAYASGQWYLWTPATPG